MWKDNSQTSLNEWQQTDCRVDVCHMTTAAHIESLSTATLFISVH